MMYATEKLYVNQISLELVEVLMTRMVIDPKNKSLLKNRSISKLEVIFNVEDVVQTRMIRVHENLVDYLALTMYQKVPRPIPDPEQMHIIDAVSEIDIIGTDLGERY